MFKLDSTLELWKQVKMHRDLVNLGVFPRRQMLWPLKLQITWYASFDIFLCGTTMLRQSFMRRLKFQYLENNAKDKYVKTIVNDEAPMITADTNADLQAANSLKKEKLKSAKTRLAERHGDIRNLAPLVENGEVHFQSD